MKGNIRSLLKQRKPWPLIFQVCFGVWLSQRSKTQPYVFMGKQMNNSWPELTKDSANSLAFLSPNYSHLVHSLQKNCLIDFFKITSAMAITTIL